MQGYQDLEDVSFLLKKISVKETILSIIGVQTFFYLFSVLFSVLYSALPPSVLATLPNKLFDVSGILSFAADMWLIAFLFSMGIIFCHQLKIIQQLSVYNSIVFSFVIIVFSLFREASTINITVFVLVALSLVLKVNGYYLEKQTLKKLIEQQ